jgi:sensor domain CHASE-containing protein
MTEQINNPKSKKINFAQSIVPILLSVMVVLLGLITWGVKTSYSEAKASQNIQNNINIQVLENLGTLNANCKVNGSEVDGLIINDRRQDILLTEHELRLKLLNK